MRSIINMNTRGIASLVAIWTRLKFVHFSCLLSHASSLKNKWMDKKKWKKREWNYRENYFFTSWWHEKIAKSWNKKKENLQEWEETFLWPYMSHMKKITVGESLHMCQWIILTLSQSDLKYVLVNSLSGIDCLQLASFLCLPVRACFLYPDDRDPSIFFHSLDFMCTHAPARVFPCINGLLSFLEMLLDCMLAWLIPSC